MKFDHDAHKAMEDAAKAAQAKAAAFKQWMEPSASTLLRTRQPRSLWGRVLRAICNWL